jgi:nucleoside phosphorylase
VAPDAVGSGGVLVLAPMVLELKAVARALSLRRRESSPEPLYVGASPVGAVDAVLGGMGFVSSSGVVDRMLDRHRYDRVVVCGIAGGLRPGIAIGAVVVPERVVDVDSGAEFQPSPLSGHDSAGTLASHHEFITDPEVVTGWVDRGYMAIDMETAAVAQVCERRGCAWSVVRSISDVPSDHVDNSAFEMANNDGTVRPATAARYLVSHPRRIPKMLAVGLGASRAARNAAAALDAAMRAG